MQDMEYTIEEASFSCSTGEKRQAGNPPPPSSIACDPVDEGIITKRKPF
jgi:hypothetical protein